MKQSGGLSLTRSVRKTIQAFASGYRVGASKAKPRIASQVLKRAKKALTKPKKLKPKVRLASLAKKVQGKDPELQRKLAFVALRMEKLRKMKSFVSK